MLMQKRCIFIKYFVFTNVASFASVVGLRSAHEAHNHQDALMSWLTPAGYVFVNELIDVLEQGLA